MLIFNLLLREGSHGDQLVKEPFVGLPQKPQFHVHVAFVHNEDELFSQALMEFCAVFLREARLFYDFQLSLIRPTIHSNFLTVQVKGRESHDKFFIHLVALEAWILEHLHRHLILARLKDSLLVEATIDHLQDLVFFSNFSAHVVAVGGRNAFINFTAPSYTSRHLSQV